MILKNYGGGFQDVDMLLDDLWLNGKKAGLIDSEWFISQVERLSRRFDDLRYRELMKLIISSPGFSMMNDEFEVPASPVDREVVRADYRLGHVVGYEDVEVGVSHDSLNNHTLVGGSSGFGKTSVLNLLAEQILCRGGVAMWIVDPKTKMLEYRRLAECFDNVIVLPLDKLLLNLFAPIPGVPRRVLRSFAAQVLGDVWNVYDASFGVIINHVINVFKNVEVPNFADLAKSILAEKKSTWTKRRSYIDTLEVRLAITQGELGGVLNCREDLFSGLWGRNVIFEVGGVSDTALKILVSFIIMKLSAYKTFNATSSLSQLLLFEESQTIFDRNLEHRGRIPLVGQLAMTCRSSGMGLVVLAQEPGTKIISSMVSNSANILCFHIGGREVRDMALSMGLTMEQARLFQHLSPGEAIFKSNFGRYSEPLHVQVDYKKFDTPSDSFIAQKMRPVWDSLRSCVSVDPPPKKDKVGVAGHTEKPRLADAEMLMLSDIQANPYEFTQDRYDRIDLGRNTAVKTKRTLERKGLIMEENLKRGNAGKPPTLLYPTEKAGEFIVLKKRKGRGSSAHVFWQYVICHFAKELKFTAARIEDAGCDVSLQLLEVSIAVEVCLRTENVLHHIERNRKAGFSEQWLLVRDEKAKRSVVTKIKNEIPDALKTDVRVGLLCDVLVLLRRKHEAVQEADN